MKSKILFFVGIFLLDAQLYAAEETAADKFIAFENMEMGHKADWFDHMKKIHDNKYDLLKQTHADWVAYRNQNSRNWQDNTDCSAGKKDAIFTDHLNRAVELHRKHIDQFKNLSEAQNKEALQIQARHSKELDDFMGVSKQKAPAPTTATQATSATPAK